MENTRLGVGMFILIRHWSRAAPGRCVHSLALPASPACGSSVLLRSKKGPGSITGIGFKQSLEHRGQSDGTQGQSTNHVCFIPAMPWQVPVLIYYMKTHTSAIQTTTTPNQVFPQLVTLSMTTVKKTLYYDHRQATKESAHKKCTSRSGTSGDQAWLSFQKQNGPEMGSLANAFLC